MFFFESANAVLSQNKVMPFPKVGIDHLTSKIPTDENLAKFHHKLISFILSLIPTPTDVLVRQHIIDMLCTRIKTALEEFPLKPIILPSGSCMNGTFLPRADIDIAIFFFPSACRPMEVMESIMRELKYVVIDGFQPLPQASVPVLKFKIPPGISIDISFDELQGPLNVLAVRSIFEKMPYLLPVQVFIKAVLHNRMLDQPYKGGIGSYTIQLMLVSYVQHTGEPNNITELLLGFCNFFGNIFNFTLTGIDVTGSGTFFSRFKTNTLSLDTPASLYIRDPLNCDNVLGLNAFRIDEIRNVFKEIHQKIISGDWEEIFDSLSADVSENVSMHTLNEKYAMKNNL